MNGGGALRVLFAVDGLWVGGTERSIVEMLPGLQERGIEPEIVSFRRRREEGVEDEVPAHLVHFLEVGGLWRQVWALRRLLRRQRPAILHTSLFHSNLVGRLAALGLPTVVLNSLVNTPYDAARFDDPRLRAWRLRVVQLFDRWSGALWTDHFHAVSHSVAAAAGRDLGVAPERITVVERGRDPERLGGPSRERRRTARLALGLDPSDEVVVNVGREEYQKGQEHLLRAVASLAPQRPRLVLVVAGRRGAATGRLRELTAELGIESRVRWLGHRTDVPEILAAADLFAFPSLFEGYPGAVLEAMALALPVVASDIAPVREIVGDEGCGLLVPPADPAALASALARLLSEPALATTLGARGRELFLARHTVDASVERMAALYRRLEADR